MKATKLLLAAAASLGLVMAGPAALAGSDSNPLPTECQQFVRDMVDEIRVVGWIGIEMERHEDGTLTILRIQPESPAKAAGLKPGDLLVSRNGIAYGKENSEQLWMEHRRSRPGDVVTLGVMRTGRRLDIDVTLGSIPHQALATMIGYEMMGMAGVEKEMEERAVPKPPKPPQPPQLPHDAAASDR